MSAGKPEYRVYPYRLLDLNIAAHRVLAAASEFGKDGLLGLSNRDWIFVRALVHLPTRSFNVSDQFFLQVCRHPHAERLPVDSHRHWVAMHCGSGWISKYKELKAPEAYVEIEFVKPTWTTRIWQRFRCFVASATKWTWAGTIFTGAAFGFATYWGLDPSVHLALRITVSVAVGVLTGLLSLVTIEAIGERWRSGLF